MRANKKSPLKTDKKTPARSHKRGVVGYSKKTALLEEAITQMNAGKYGRSSAALKELLTLDPQNMEARRLFATLHLRLGSLIPARQAFESLIDEAFERQDYWLAESLLREYLTAGPRCVPFIEKLGALYQEKGDALEAVAEYGKAIDILIEDPDPDNPHHAAQLFAKIRDLAPASPVALRLAPLFDAQTGELIARPPTTYAETAREDSAVAPVEPRVDPAARNNAVPGEMPWERTTGGPNAGEAGAIKEPVSAVEPPAPSIDRSVDNLKPQGSDDASIVPELRADGTIGEEDDAEVAVPAAKSADVAPANEPFPSPSVEQVPGAVPAGDHSVSATLADHATEPLPLHRQRETVGESVSGLMPWERVEESAIDGPESVPGSPPTSGGEPGEAMIAPSPASESADQSSAGLDENQPLITVAPRVPENTVSGDQQPVEQASTGPQSDISPALPEPVKTGGFSWDSIFNSAWRFSDAVAPETQQQASVTSDNVVADEFVTTESSLKCEETAANSTGTPSWDQSRSDSESDVSSASVTAPMPWEQVQESVVTIPPAQLDESVNGSAEGMSLQVPFQEPDRGDAEPPAVESSHQTTSLSIAEPPDGPVPSEPDFRFVVATESIPSTQSTDLSALDEEESGKHPLKAVDPFPASTDSAPPSFHIAAPPSSEGVPTDEESVGSRVFSPEPAQEPDSALDDPRSWLGEEAVLSRAPEFPESPVASVGSMLDSDAGITLRSEPVAPLSGHERTDRDQVPPSTGEAQHWETGEVAVQPQRPASKTEPAEPVGAEHSEPPRPIEAAVPIESIDLRQDEPVVAPVEAPRLELVQEKEEWIRTGESIRFVDSPPDGKAESTQQASIPSEAPPPPAVSAVAAAVDVLFESSGRLSKTGTRERGAEARPHPRFRAKLSRIRIAIALFIGSCFSTTRAIVTTLVAFVVLSCALVAVGIGAIGLAWILMEESPSPAFQNLTTNPHRTLADPRRNGYLLLLGFDAPPGQDPIQAGYERKPNVKDADLAWACLGGGDSGSRGTQLNASAGVVRGWFRGADPPGQFKSNQDTIKAWTSLAESALARYKQWQKLPFEDWGYGQTVSPPCGAILFTHQLFVADGFVQGMDIGIDRLEADLEAWRIALAQAKTLPVKMLALQAINDDIAVASAILVRPDFDGKHLGRLVKILRPFDQVELSIRWPMQSELVSATKNFEAQLKAVRGEDPPLHVALAAALPLPKQRRFNGYAAYYEASYKAAGEGRYGSLPKWKNYIRFPAVTFLDYLSNPIENIVGLEPLAPWDLYNGLVVDTDARLRLASLQAWLRRGPQDADPLARIAKAGQNFYDPYTGLPMLVNLKKRVMYSVGHDGKDQDADPQSDVVVAIPGNPTSTGSGKAFSIISK